MATCGQALRASEPCSPPCPPHIRLFNPGTQPLNLGLVIFGPISSVPGSASLFYLQPLITGRVWASEAVLLGAQIFLFLANLFFGLETVPVQRPGIGGRMETVRMSASDLRDFLRAIADGAATSSAGAGASGLSAGGGANEFMTVESPETPTVVGLSLFGSFTDKPYSPYVFFTFPVFTLPGSRGALPLLILETLATIFVRAVVPPQTTGAKPLAGPSTRRSVQFSPEDLVHLLRRFGKHFGAEEQSQ